MNQQQIERMLARRKYDDGYYKEKLQEGLEFQDVVTKALYQLGIVIVGYASKYFQIEEGENILGAEIKRDGNFRKTGNLYIEIAEKAHPDNPKFVRSGIRRKDNSWLFIIGDEERIYIFATRHLRKLQKKYKIVSTSTSKGFLMPLKDARKYCIRKIDFEVPLTFEDLT